MNFSDTITINNLNQIIKDLPIELTDDISNFLTNNISSKIMKTDYCWILITGKYGFDFCRKLSESIKKRENGN
jgi:hypothetical protein